MQLHLIDWVIVGLSIAICFIPALFVARRSGKNTTEFFASGRSVPWWLAGLSMVATTFSSETPLLVTNMVREEGIAGNWRWWAFVLTGVATVFFYAQLWRRSGVLTDLEFYEMRYSGRAARFLRGFRAIYLGLFFNGMIMASVNLAACKFTAVFFGMNRWQTLLAVGLLNVVFAAHSGLWGVLIIDMIQFFIKMAAVIAAAYFVLQLPEIGGLSGLVEKLSTRQGPGGLNYLNLLPDFANQWEMAVAVFIMPLAVQWWAVWYPGAEPGGGSFIAQRMLASRTEKDALAGTLFFNIAHYVLRPWPWLLVALASIIIYPTAHDIRNAFPGLDPTLIGEDMAYPVMLRYLPIGWMGLMVGGLIAANSSTILTLLNWGASYLVHDFYQRFIKPGATEAHYVWVGRLATVGLFLFSSMLVFALNTAKENFDIILQVGAGTGLLYLIRWFWWRVNAWCEVVAMISSFGLSVVFLLLRRYHLNPDVISLGTHVELLLTVGFTTVCWLAAAFLAPPTDQQILIEFYRKVHPFGPGWNPIRVAAGISDAQAAEYARHENIPLALLGWTSGCAVIWSSLFALGNFLYGRYVYASILLAVFLLFAYALIRVIQRLWR